MINYIFILIILASIFLLVLTKLIKYDEIKKINKSKFKITKFKSLKRDSIINLYNYKFYFFFEIKINLLHWVMIRSLTDSHEK